MTPVFGMFNLSPVEILMILGLGVLLFGRKLPEVGKYLGKGIVEFKKGLKGLEDEVDAGAAAPRHEPAALDQPRPPQRVMTQAPKFEETPNNQVTTPPKRTSLEQADM
jgi:sec-independent protein translocase protein TatA